MFDPTSVLELFSWLKWLEISKPEVLVLGLLLLLLFMLPVVPLLERKGRLKRLEPGGGLLLLFVLAWRSENCISPWYGLFGNKPCGDWCSSWNCWFASEGRKKAADEGMAEAGWGGRKDEPRRWSNCPARAPPALPRRKTSLPPDWLFWSWIEDNWGPTWDKPKPVLLLFPYKLLPMVLKLGGCLALSCASASQKARWVIKLSRLNQ